ncbi:MAG: hypothetical protein KatS3mg020_1078 [Fimbriimonadales bacterium]|nr:MAG: hypothetical protein KatS3mg020_1078 [Fimbriimonadales bacterium]
MSKMSKLASAVIVALLSGTLAAAQSGGGYDLTWWTIDGGGITFATGGSFELGGTAGQPDATRLNELAGGAFRMTGGFWFVSCLITNGDVDGNGCVDDADLLQVLFNFGATGFNLADVNCDAIVDDADLLTVLFNFGSGC